MYFSDSYELRQLEKLMRSIPNFRPRGHGVVILRRYEYTEKDCDCRACPYHISRKKGCGTDKCPCINERITAGAATLKEAVAETMAAIQYPPFVKRLNQYLKESEENPMYFKNEKHRTAFTEAVAKLDKKDYALMAAVYLLTADCRLWSCTGRYVQRNEILFENIRLKGSTANGYTLYCTAKDLYLGTKNLTVADLAYARAEYLNNEDSFHDYYSDVEISCAASKAHPKAAIQIRNREMVDRADLVLCAIERQSGGSWQTVQYAMKQEKPVINLFDEPDE